MELEQELLALLSLTKKIYTFKVDDNVMIAEDNLSYYLDTKIKKMAEIHHDVLEKFYKPNYIILKKTINS